MALVPGTALQVDIFVTKTPKDSEPISLAGSSREGASFCDDHNPLLVPNPRDGAPGRYDGGDCDYEKGLGGNGNSQEDSAYELPDYTHFGGDLDAEAVPAEELFSSGLRQEGALRRKMARNETIGHRTQDMSVVRAMLPKTQRGAPRSEDLVLQFTDEELEDLLAITERGWPGRPMLDKLLKEEVDQAKGPIVVAC